MCSVSPFSRNIQRLRRGSPAQQCLIACILSLCTYLAVQRGPDGLFTSLFPLESCVKGWNVRNAQISRLNTRREQHVQPDRPHLNQHTCPLLGPSFPKPRHIYLDSLEPYTKNFNVTLENALMGGENAYGDFDNVTNSFSIAVWSAASNDSLFEYHLEGPELNRERQPLNNDTVYRVGSISKLFTVYAYLATTGEIHLDEPITNFVPELARMDSARAQDLKGSDVDSVRWSHITPRSLAAQLSGLPRDYGLGDLTGMLLDDDLLGNYGLPPLKAIPKPLCYPFTVGQNTLCSREEFFQGISEWHPIARPYTTPTYSNPNFGILAWALEAIVADGRNFSQILQDNIISPLNMTRTFVSLSPDTDLTNAMIPYNASTSEWFLSGSFDDPAGNYYSSLNDLNALGRSIVRSSLLPQPLTNRWLKPLSHTSDPSQAVGMPWEIYRHEVPVSSGSSATRLVDMYTKAGDVGLYSSMIVLVPDYDIGFTVLVAGAAQRQFVRVYLAEMLRDHFLPAMEELAASDAERVFGGTYVDETTNSSVTVALSPDRVGLGLENWVSRGIDMQEDGKGFKGLYGSDIDGDIELRLQPMDLVDENRHRVAFRIIPKDSAFPDSFLWRCFSWAQVDALTYGGIGVDEVVFELDHNGKAEAVDLRAFRTVLKRPSTT